MTVAFGMTAPDGSETNPVTSPETRDCAEALIARKTATHKIRKQSRIGRARIIVLGTEISSHSLVCKPRASSEVRIVPLKMQAL